MISISISRIVESVLAVSALRATTHSSRKTAVLNSENNAALRRAACDVAARSLLHMLPAIKSTNIRNIDPEEDDIITVELRTDGIENGCIQRAFEAAVSAGVLASAYAAADDDAADTELRRFETLLARIDSMLPHSYPQRIRPYA